MAQPPIELWFGLLTPVLLLVVAALVRIADIERKFTTGILLYGAGLIALYAGLSWWMCTPQCRGF